MNLQMCQGNLRSLRMCERVFGLTLSNAPFMSMKRTTEYELLAKLLYMWEARVAMLSKQDFDLRKLN